MVLNDSIPNAPTEPHICWIGVARNRPPRAVSFRRNGRKRRGTRYWDYWRGRRVVVFVLARDDVDRRVGKVLRVGRCGSGQCNSSRWLRYDDRLLEVQLVFSGQSHSMFTCNEQRRYINESRARVPVNSHPLPRSGNNIMSRMDIFYTGVRFFYAFCTRPGREGWTRPGMNVHPHGTSKVRFSQS